MPRRTSRWVRRALTAVRHLHEIGVLELPRRKVGGNAIGFSGAGYEGWEEAPAETVSISQARMIDRTTAILTLDDGRQLHVDLTGTGEQSDQYGGRAVVTVDLSGPALASMSIEEIRARLRLMPPLRGAWAGG